MYFLLQILFLLPLILFLIDLFFQNLPILNLLFPFLFFNLLIVALVFKVNPGFLLSLLLLLELLLHQVLFIPLPGLQQSIFLLVLIYFLCDGWFWSVQIGGLVLLETTSQVIQLLVALWEEVSIGHSWYHGHLITSSIAPTMGIVLNVSNGSCQIWISNLKLWLSLLWQWCWHSLPHSSHNPCGISLFNQLLKHVLLQLCLQHWSLTVNVVTMGKWKELSPLFSIHFKTQCSALFLFELDIGMVFLSDFLYIILQLVPLALNLFLVHWRLLHYLFW